MASRLPISGLDHDVEDILAFSITIVRIFINVYSYSAGAHKITKGHHAFPFMMQNILVHLFSICYNLL